MVGHVAPRDSQCKPLLEKFVLCANLATCLPSEIRAASADQITIPQKYLDRNHRKLFYEINPLMRHEKSDRARNPTQIRRKLDSELNRYHQNTTSVNDPKI